MHWVINLRIALFKLQERMRELFFPVKGIVSKLASLYCCLDTWSLFPSLIRLLFFWSFLNCSLKHGVDLFECLQSGPKKKSTKKSLKVTLSIIVSLFVYNIYFILVHLSYIHSVIVRMFTRRMILKNGFLLMWSLQKRLVLPLRTSAH